MNYLEDIPKEANEYGIHKVLTVRALSIDWKHRDTEIHLRTPTLVESIDSCGITLQEMYEIRSRQLRHIYHLSRATFKRHDPNSLTTNNLFKDHTLIREYCDIVYVDIKLLLESANGVLIYNKLIKSKYCKVVVYDSTGVFTERTMINFFIKRSIKLPWIFRSLQFRDIVNSLKEGIITVLFNEGTLSTDQQQCLWVLNAHLMIGYTDGPIMPLKFKTDKKIKD